MEQTDPPAKVASNDQLGLGAEALTNPPLGTLESARDIVQTIALALKNGYTPNEILDENSPIAERIWAEATTLRLPQKAYFLDDDSDRLKPCPFCGSDAEFGEIGEGQDTGGHFVQCLSSACGASSALIFPLMDDVKALLLERWNKRPNV